MGLKFGWQELPTAEDVQLWIHPQLDVALLFDVVFFMLLVVVLVTNTHWFIQRPHAPAAHADLY